MTTFCCPICSAPLTGHGAFGLIYACGTCDQGVYVRGENCRAPAEVAGDVALRLVGTNIERLAAYIRRHGPIKTARISSAQARGAAKQYPYWGAVRYQIDLTADGCPTNRACERASSDRRSRRLAEADCEALCKREGRHECEHIGRIPEEAAASWLAAIAAV